MSATQRPDAEASGGEKGTATSLWDAAAGAHAGWKEGERAGLDELVRMLTPPLWHAARSYGLSQDAASDVVQNAWLTLVRAGDSINDSQAVGSWLLTTTRRLAWRASRLREIPVEECAPRFPDRTPSPEDATIAGFEARALWDAVRALDARCQRLLRIIAFDDRPDYAALSAETGMPVGSIGPTRPRCLDKLRLRLEGT